MNRTRPSNPFGRPTPFDPRKGAHLPLDYPRTLLAEIESEVGSGVYTWTRFSEDGPKSGSATELNESTGIVAGTKVVLHRSRQTWYFFFPIEEC